MAHKNFKLDEKWYIYKWYIFAAAVSAITIVALAIWFGFKQPEIEEIYGADLIIKTIEVKTMNQTPNNFPISDGDHLTNLQHTAQSPAGCNVNVVFENVGTTPSLTAEYTLELLSFLPGSRQLHKKWAQM